MKEASKNLLNGLPSHSDPITRGPYCGSGYLFLSVNVGLIAEFYGVSACFGYCGGESRFNAFQGSDTVGANTYYSSCGCAENGVGLEHVSLDVSFLKAQRQSKARESTPRNDDVHLWCYLQLGIADRPFQTIHFDVQVGQCN